MPDLKASRITKLEQLYETKNKKWVQFKWPATSCPETATSQNLLLFYLSNPFTKEACGQTPLPLTPPSLQLTDQQKHFKWVKNCAQAQKI